MAFSVSSCVSQSSPCLLMTFSAAKKPVFLCLDIPEVTSQERPIRNDRLPAFSATGTPAVARRATRAQLLGFGTGLSWFISAWAVRCLFAGPWECIFPPPPSTRCSSGWRDAPCSAAEWLFWVMVAKVLHYFWVVWAVGRVGQWGVYVWSQRAQTCLGERWYYWRCLSSDAGTSLIAAIGERFGPFGTCSQSASHTLNIAIIPSLGWNLKNRSIWQKRRHWSRGTGVGGVLIKYSDNEGEGGSSQLPNIS